MSTSCNLSRERWSELLDDPSARSSLDANIPHDHTRNKPNSDKVTRLLRLLHVEDEPLASWINWTLC